MQIKLDYNKKQAQKAIEIIADLKCKDCKLEYVKLYASLHMPENLIVKSCIIGFGEHGEFKDITYQCIDRDGNVSSCEFENMAQRLQFYADMMEIELYEGKFRFKNS